ncbi:flagellar basal-body rod protein FlgG [Helicobacter monodelphidis]|uniref:flagellar basal-body rod protein FlgG n=1 Tax=Helicobacter sp. 15-1451 TaxID=2004995 RepID=UPI000DCF5B7C|nr:flagellar basal-body rod protein FlgG [Helicobacter sp. 15-1451]RAX58683.1 flagellar basal-body rod protein FlgG [Helicobacter sp. 15-1451]
MMRSLYTATTGMIGMQMQIDVVSNNISNVNVNGYKKQRAEFQDLFSQTLQYAGSNTSETTQSPTGIEVGVGVRPSSVQKIMTNGTPMQTENPLDMMIDGRGFFQIELPDGTIAYTRDGSFKLDSEGNIVNSQGYLLIPNMTIPEEWQDGTIGVSKDGIVTVTLAGDNQVQEIGQIETANFINPAGLHSLGDNLFVNTDASGDPVVGAPNQESRGQVLNGVLERSNVKLVEEMTELITGQRAYEANSKSIQTSDSMLQTVIGLKR